MRLAPYTADDRDEVAPFLSRPRGVHLYLLDRLDALDRGRGFVGRAAGRVVGFAWFGAGKNLALAGDDPEFLRGLVGRALELERAWLMVVGPYGPVTDFLRSYMRNTTRRPRLDRSQGFFVQDTGTLPKQREPGLVPATPDDLDDLAAAAARMSAEDFEIDLYRIDRQALRRGLEEKVRWGRSFVLRDAGRLAFKVDLAVLSPEGCQVEGVFTETALRGRGIATRCMTELGHRMLGETPYLSLHVNSTNTPALKAYERSGYRRKGEFRLAIFPAAGGW